MSKRREKQLPASPDGTMPQERESFRRLPPKQNNHTVIASTYSGPLPSPEMMERYEAVVPGSAERIITQFEEQGRHRRTLEKVVVTGNERRANRGQISATVIVIFGILSGTFLIYEGKTSEGLGAMLTPLGVVASIFVGGKMIQRKDLKRKEKEVRGQ
jgi:uncharacterized membrane protein